MILPKQSIYVPGRGHIDLDAVRVHRVIHEYDDRLHFGFNEANRDWTVYYILERKQEAPYIIDGQPAYPVVGFGKNIPSTEVALDKMRSIDTRIVGDKKLKEVNENNAKIKKALEEKAQEADAQAAEVLEWGYRKANN